MTPLISSLILLFGGIALGALAVLLYLDEPVSQRARRAPDAGSRSRHPSHLGPPADPPDRWADRARAAGRPVTPHRFGFTVAAGLTMLLTAAMVFPIVGVFLVAWVLLSFGIGAAWITACAIGQRRRLTGPRTQCHVCGHVAPDGEFPAHLAAVHPDLGAVRCGDCGQRVEADVWPYHVRLRHSPRPIGLEDTIEWRAS